MCKYCEDYEGYKAAKDAMENYLTNDDCDGVAIKPLSSLYKALDSYACFTYYNGLGWVDVFLYDGGMTFENDEYTFGKLDEANKFSYCPHCGRKL